MMACAACEPNSISATIRPGANSWRRSEPIFRMRCNRKSTAGRALLRQRTDKDIPAGADVDNSEVDETAALIDFVAVCRTFASELAINEVTLRTYSDLQHYVEQSTEALVQTLRGGDSRGRAYRQQQGKGALR